MSDTAVAVAAVAVVTVAVAVVATVVLASGALLSVTAVMMFFAFRKNKVISYNSDDAACGK